MFEAPTPAPKPEPATPALKKPAGICGRFFGFFGIHRSATKGHWLVLTRRFKIITLVTILVFVGALAAFGLHYSNQPGFCGSCHIMKPYYASWATSKHNEVKCASCHIPPGGVVRAKVNGLSQVLKDMVGTEGPIKAQVQDSACLRDGCHQTSQLTGKKLTLNGKYNFDHTAHLGQMKNGMELRCATCHAHTTRTSHFGVNESTCFTCHFKGKVLDSRPVNGCTTCHDAPSKPVKTATDYMFNHKPLLARGVQCTACHIGSVQGDGAVRPQACRTCHDEPEKLARMSDKSLMHGHVTIRKVDCLQCHTEIYHGHSAQQLPGAVGNCQTCHGEGHSAHMNMLAGTGGVGVPDSPGKHYMAHVTCAACHENAIAPSHADVGSKVPSDATCSKCHGSAMKGMVKNWQDMVGDSLKDADVALAAARKACDALPEGSPARASAKAPLDAAAANLKLVHGASPAHNIEYAMALLDKAAEDARQAAKLCESAAATKPSSNEKVGD